MKTFDPKQLSVVVGGHIVQGYADGTFVECARNNDTFTRAGGADGEQTRFKSNDRSGTVTITLMQSSTSNSILEGYAIADESENGGIVSIIVKDNNGTEICSAAYAWVQKPADKAHAKENSDRTWIFETGELVFTGGGIAPPQ